MARSINQNAYSGALPNFRNLGILLRILLIVNVIAVTAALVKASGLRALWQEFVEISAVVQPLLVLSLLVLAVLSDALRRLPYALGVCAVLALETGLTTALYYAGGTMLTESGQLERYWLLVALTAAALLAYLDLRGRALSPALSEARLQALQARIRPHFLYNSINAVLSLIRQDPRRAEAALEDMADLFRVVMADNRELAPLAREVELCRQYLGLEQLRLGGRLRVEWQVDRMPRDAMVPPLVIPVLAPTIGQHFSVIDALAHAPDFKYPLLILHGEADGFEERDLVDATSSGTTSQNQLAEFSVNVLFVDQGQAGRRALGGHGFSPCGRGRRRGRGMTLRGLRLS